MKPFTKFSTLLAAGLLVLGTRLTADTFDFSYAFANGTVYSGTLTGTRNGLFVEGVSNITLAQNGVSKGSIPQMSHYGFDTPESVGRMGDPIFSFDPFLVNFHLGTGFDGPDGWSFDIYTISNNTYAFSSAGYFNQNDGDGFAGPVDSGTWSLVERGGSSVPDSGSTAILTLLGFGGLLAARRRQGAAKVS